MNPAENELWRKAEQAAWHYHALYGVFPAKIGVHYKRSELLYRHIAFPVLPKIPVMRTGMESFLPATIERRIIPFAAVAGEGISMNEVYVPVFASEDPNAVIGGTQLAALAHRKDHTNR